jgi:metal-responsive CopG/Arc/MetJ family transcriptional regulator
MHVYVKSQEKMMRTTVEITDDQRTEIARIASIRGLKGYSQVIQEALQEYIEREHRRHEVIEAALKLQGSLSTREGGAMEKARLHLRGTWR